MKTMEELIRAELELFYSKLFNKLYSTYPKEDKKTIRLAVDSVVEESLDWDGYAY